MTRRDRFFDVGVLVPLEAGPVEWYRPIGCRGRGLSAYRTGRPPTGIGLRQGVGSRRAGPMRRQPRSALLGRQSGLEHSSPSARACDLQRPDVSAPFLDRLVAHQIASAATDGGIAISLAAGIR